MLMYLYYNIVYKFLSEKEVLKHNERELPYLTCITFCCITLYCMLVCTVNVDSLKCGHSLIRTLDMIPNAELYLLIMYCIIAMFVCMCMSV